MANQLDQVLDQQGRRSQIDRICRFCLCEPMSLVPLGTDIRDMFAALTGVQIDLDDPYPKRLCGVCVDKLENAFAIRKEFLDNVAALERYFADGEVVVKEEKMEEEIVIKNEPIELEMSNEEGDSSGSEYSPEYMEESKESEQYDIDGLKKKIPKRRLEIIGEPSVMDPLKCYICNAQFVDARELNIHLPQHADKLPYACEPCGSFQKKIITVVMLHRHFQMHAGTIECPHCPVRVYNKKRLNAHFKRYHSKLSRANFTCEKCDYQLNSKESYQSHMVRHNAIEEGRFTCMICDKKFGNNARLKRHELIHQETKEYQCQYCSKTIISKTLLLTHEREHVAAGDLKQYACAFCDERFSSRSSQNKHMSAVHPELVERRSTEKPREDMKCPFEGCNFIANSYQSWHNHKNRHQNRFVCPLCQKIFPNRQALNIHKNSHLDKANRPFACDQCAKTFVSKVCLKQHQVVHNKDLPKPFMCSTCGEAFIAKARLDNHVLKHSEPLHHCEFCERSFRYQGDWTRHMKQHTELKMEVARIEKIC